MRIVEPIAAVLGADSPFGSRIHLDPGTRVQYILPTHLVRQTIFVVSGGVELIKGIALAIVGIAVACREVEFGDDARLPREGLNRPAYQPVARPCVDGVRAK